MWRGELDKQEMAVADEKLRDWFLLEKAEDECSFTSFHFMSQNLVWLLCYMGDRGKESYLPLSDLRICQTYRKCHSFKEDHFQSCRGSGEYGKQNNLWSQFGARGTLYRKSNLRTREEAIYLFLLINLRFELADSISFFFILIYQFPQLFSYNVNFTWPSGTEMDD